MKSKKRKKKKLTMWVNVFRLDETHYAVSQYPYKTRKIAKAYVRRLVPSGQQQYIKTVKIKI